MCFHQSWIYFHGSCVRFHIICFHGAFHQFPYCSSHAWYLDSAVGLPIGTLLPPAGYRNTMSSPPEPPEAHRSPSSQKPWKYRYFHGSKPTSLEVNLPPCKCKQLHGCTNTFVEAHVTFMGVYYSHGSITLGVTRMEISTFTSMGLKTLPRKYTIFRRK